MQIQGNDSGADQELEYPAGWDDGGEAKFHEGAFVGGEDDAHPVEGVAAFRAEDAVNGYLATDEVDEEGDGGVEYFFFVVDEAGGFVDEGEDADGGLEDLEDSKAHCDYMIFLNYYFF